MGFGGQWGYYRDYTGLYLLGHRYYDAGAGRFLTRDPIGYGGGINLYGFAGNNPVNRMDPEGTDPDDPTGLPDDGDLSMRSLHPGMAAGTAQSNTARAMTRSLLSTLEDAIVGIINPEGKAAEAVEEAVQAARAVRAEKVSIGALRAAGRRDAHHIIQDAAVRDLPGYRTNDAPGIQLRGPANDLTTPHGRTRLVQKQRGGGTYAAERRIGYKTLRRAGISPAEARMHIRNADEYFSKLGVGPATPTRIPADRR